MNANRESMEEKDEKIAHLERLVRELQGAQQESAATTLHRSERHLSLPRGVFNSYIKASMLKITFSILIVSILISGGFWLFNGNTFKAESVTYVESVKELATLATVKSHMKVVLQEEDNKIFGKDISTNLFGTKREILLVVPSTVIAGVDLKKVTSQDMVINEETKEIDITLPHAKFIQDPALQMDKIVTFVDGGLFRDEVDWEKGYDLASKAQEKTLQEAKSEGLLLTAEENAEIVLKEFFKNINYTVNVKFN